VPGSSTIRQPSEFAVTTLGMVFTLFRSSVEEEPGTITHITRSASGGPFGAFARYLYHRHCLSSTGLSAIGLSPWQAWTGVATS